MSRNYVKVAMFIVIILVLAVAAPALGKGKPSGGETAVNNLSFPAIAVDGFPIATVAPSFTMPYTGTYPGLTADAIALLTASGPWYAQKTVNKWQAEFVTQSTEAVTYVDWGDNIESNNPKVGAPTRLEVTLYKELALHPSGPTMTGYTMAVLEYPSSSTELQGTNTLPYESLWATVVSGQPKLVIQFLGTTIPTTMTWLGTQWDSYTIIPQTFAPELNVGGKYIFGASQGGWKPANRGYYRITFYVPGGTGVSLATAVVGNASGTAGTAATPKVDGAQNLTYVDVLVVAKGGGGGKKP